MKRFVAAMMLVLVAGAAGIGLLYGLPEEPKPPNVVLILLETVGAGAIEGERDGYHIMPNLKRYAGESRFFDHTVSASGCALGAVASIFTSEHADGHRVSCAGRENAAGTPRPGVLDDAFVTPAEWLRGHGYQTFCAQSNPDLSAGAGMAQGFAKDDYVRMDHADSAWVTSIALGGAWAMDEPFFLYAHYTLADVPADGSEKYAPPWPAADDAGARYDAACHYLDFQLDRLIERLRHDFPNTLFVVASAPGGELAGHEDTVHGPLPVPFMIFGAGVEPRIDPVQADLIDVFPTVGGLIGLPPVDTWEGHDRSIPTPESTRDGDDTPAAH